MFYGALLLASASGSATAQVVPEVGAVGIVQTSGSVIAGALSCGVAADRVLVIGRRAIEQAHRTAPNISVEQLAKYHTDAVATATRAYGRMTPAQCRAALKSYRQIEDMLTLGR